MHKMQGIMAGLRTNAPKTIAGYEVAEVVDYDADGTGLPPRRVLEYRLVNGAKLMVRPSGTEPKIKVYLSAVANSEGRRCHQHRHGRCGQGLDEVRL